MADVLSNGIKIHYERSGGAKLPLLLCHGLGDSGQCWPRVAAALAGDYDLIMLDARAHGRSDAPDSGYSYNTLADDVAGVIQSLGLRKPCVMGHSMGAMTAAFAAVRHPDLVGRLVLEDPPWRDATETEAERTAWATKWQTDIDVRKGMSMEQMVEFSTRTNPGVAMWDKSEFPAWSDAKKWVSLHIVQLLLKPMPGYQDIVARLTCPTLLLTADPARGGIVTPEVARKITLLNPRIQVAHIPDAGHNIRRESFDAYMAAVTAFLSGHTSSVILPALGSPGSERSM